MECSAQMSALDELQLACQNHQKPVSALPQAAHVSAVLQPVSSAQGFSEWKLATGDLPSRVCQEPLTPLSIIPTENEFLKMRIWVA